MPLQAAPSAQRAIDIVHFLAERPTKSFAVAMIARSVGQSRATCQAVLLALEASDWVNRDVAGGYCIGTGLISVGMAAQQGTAVVDLLSAGVHDLHSETGQQVTASIPSGRDLVVVARSGPERPLAVAMAIGQMFPLVPPYGLAFAAWGEGNLERWLDRGPELGRRARTRLRHAAGLVRQMGYSVILDASTRHALAGEAARPHEHEREELMQVLAQDEHFRSESPSSAQVSYISAPVLAAGDQVVALVGLLLQTDSAQEFTSTAAAVRSAASRISNALAVRTASMEDRTA